MDFETQKRAESFGELISYRRKRLELSRSDVAKRIGISAEQLRLYEVDQQLPPFERLEPIANAVCADLKVMISAWASLALGHRQHTRELLMALTGQGDSSPSSPIVEHISTHVEDVVSGVREKLHDFWSDLLVPQMSRHDVRSCQFDENLSFTTMPGMHAVEHRPIGAASHGLSYSALLVRIPAGWGACHQHASDRGLIPGMEFFTVVSGTGVGIIESPNVPKTKKKRPPWHEIQLQPGVAGLYRGDLFHSFLATGTDPIVVSVVCVPKADWRGFASEFELSDASSLKAPTRAHEAICTYLNGINATE